MANTKSEYKGPAAEYNERKKKQSLYKGPAYEYKANRFNKERDELYSRINAWAEDNNRLADSYKQRFEGREAGKYVSDSGEWLSILEEQRAKSDAEAASIRERLDYYKDFIGADWSKSVLDQLDSGSKFRSDVFDEATADHEYWSQWATEEDYNKAYAEYEDYQAKLNYDLEGAQAEIDRLQGEISSHWESIQPGIEKTKEYIAALEEENKKLAIYAAKGHKESANKVAENKKKIENAYAAIKEAQGKNDALKSDLSEKERYYTLAKRIQDAERLAGVADPNSEYYDPEFEKYTGYVSTNPGGIFGKLQEDITYEYINGDDETRAKLENTYQQYLLENHIEKGYGQLKPEEVAIYNYYYQKHGKEAAEEYLFSIADTLNARQAGVIFENVNDHVALEYLFGVYAGLDQFETGMENLLNSDDYIPTSATQLASGMVREDLKDNGIPLWYNFKDKKWEKEILGSSSGQIFYDAINTTSNMLPSILASAGANLILPGSGAYVGSALLGASAAGNAKAEMLNLGYSKEQANAYGLMVGASEAVLEKVLGGIPGLKGGDGIFSALGQKALSKIDNALARVAITIGGNMLDEGLEEGIQTIIEPWLAEIATKVDWEDPTVDEVLYSSLLGALSSIGFTGAGMVSSSIASNQNASKLFGDYAPELISRALEVGDPKVKALAESYQKKLDAGKTLSGSELNKLARAVVGSTSASTSADSNARADGTESDPLEALALKVRLDRVSRKDSSATENTAEKKNAVKTEFEASAVASRISFNADGSAVINEGGRTVNADNVDLSESDVGLVYQYAKDKVSSGGFNPDVANVFMRGFDASGLSAAEYVKGFSEAYSYGAQGASIVALDTNKNTSRLTEVLRERAYNLGKIFGKQKKDLQNGTDSDKINNKENANNERTEDGVRIRDGGEWNRGQNTSETVSAVEDSTGQAESEKGKRGPRDREASALTYGKEVTAKSIGIKGGLDSGKVHLIADGSETKEMSRARKRAEKRGLKATFFAGGNLQIEVDGEIASVRAFIKGDRVYIRVDHPYYTSDQLMRHEIGHDMIARGEVDPDEVRGRIEAIFGKENVEYIAEEYAYAYEGSGMSAEEIWEEIICDSLGNMNAFAKAEDFGEMNAEFLSKLKGTVKDNAKSERGPPIQKNTADSGVSKHSIEITKDGIRYVKLDGNIFLKPDGTEMSPVEAYNALVGTKITLDDGDVITFIKNLPKRSVYRELFKKMPGYEAGIDIKAVSEAINKNMVDVVKGSTVQVRNEPPRHQHIGIKDFDQREVYILDNNQTYRLELCIANLTDGTKIAYVKRYIEKATAEIDKKIKKEETARQSRLNQPSNISISQKSNLSTDSEKKSSGKTSRELDSGYSTPEEAKESGKVSDAKFSIEFAPKIADNQRAYLEKGGARISSVELEKAISDTARMVDKMIPYANILPQDKVGKTLVKNGSYDVSVENTTICIRTLAYNSFVDMVSEKIGRPLTQMESFLVSQKLYEIAKEPQCLYCYVSLDRKAFNEMIIRYTEQRDAAIEAYEEAGRPKVPSSFNADWSLFKEFLNGRKPTQNMWDRYTSWIKAYNSGERMVSLADISTEAKRLELVENGGAMASQVKDILKYAQSASWAKKQTQYVAYYDEILKLKPNVIKNLNSHYGMRWYSFSDYSGAFIVENMQQITDAAIRGLKGLSYTKDTDFAEIFAPTGMNINISVYATKTANGYEIDAKQSANIEKAIELRKKFPNVGIVVVATDKGGVEWALAQEWSDVVIPFHTVRTGADVAEFYNWEIFNAEQNDTVSDQNLWDEYVKSVGKKKVSKMVYPSEHQNDLDTYLEICKERGLTPRFKSFLDNPNYMKLVNETRQSESETAPLKAIFDVDAAERSFDKFVEKGGYYEGWYNDGIDVDGEAEIVASDVLAGKKANEVDYGRQDVDYDALKKSRKDNRTHGKASRELENHDNISRGDEYETYEGQDTEVLGGQTVSAPHRGRNGVWKQGTDPEEVYQRLADSQNGKGGGRETRAGHSGWLEEGRGNSTDVLRLRKSILGDLRRRQLSGVDTAGRFLPDDVKKTFSESVLKNERGELLSLYHWTDAVFSAFSKGDIGFHLGTINAAYMRYQDVAIKRNLVCSFYKECYVNLKKPAIIAYDPIRWDVFPTAHKLNQQGILSNTELEQLEKMAGYIHTTHDSPAAIELRKMLSKKGFDGIVYTNNHEGDISVIAFYPQQIYTVAENGVEINGKASRELDFFDYLNELPEREAVTKTELKGHIAAEKALTNRMLLANALESITSYPSERSILVNYKAMLGLIAKAERRISDIRSDVKVLSKDKKNAEFVDQLRKEEAVLLDEINRADKKLLSLESTKALKKVIDLERQKAEQRRKRDLAKQRERAEVKLAETKKQYQEARAKSVEGRHKTEMRHKIQDAAHRLDKLLNNATKERNVKKGQSELVRRVLELTDLLFASDDDLLMNGIETEVTDAELDAINKYTALYNEYHSYDDAVTENKERRKELRSEMNEVKKAFEGVLERERKRISKANAKDLFNALISEYEKIAQSKDEYIAHAFDNETKEYLEGLRDSVGDTLVKDMTLDQLEMVYKAFRMIETMVSKSNKMFNESLNATAEELGTKTLNEVLAHKRKMEFTRLGKAYSELSWNNLKPIYLMERIDSKTLQILFDNVLSAESDWARYEAEARAYSDEQKKKYGYKNWDFKKKWQFTTKTGLKFELDLGQIFTIYAYAQRGEQALNHLRVDGFVFDNLKVIKKNKLGIPIEYELNDKTAYKLDDDNLFKIVGNPFTGEKGILTADQINYVVAMQKYLSEVLGKRGNEVSEQMYGIDLFNEDNYLPIRSEGAYMERVREQAQGTPKIKNRAHTKPTVKGARNAIVLSSFNEIWSEHVTSMNEYVAFTLPLEDFYKVYNYTNKSSEDSDKRGVIPAIENAYGKAASKAVDQLLTDLNGGTRTDSRESVGKALIGAFKKAKVMLSLSVIVQQPSSIIRAQAVINPKYFVGKTDGKKHKAAWEELKKYAPVAIIKEMGYFDVGMGQTSAKWLMNEPDFMDTVDEITSWGAAKADEKTWVAIWNAVKRETIHIHKDLAPSSKEFLEIAGKRFEEVIRLTQVYDSTLSRSANMRSKSTFMQMVTAFLAEPTTSLNMREMALRSGDGKRIARTTTAVYASALLNAILVSFPYAMRDDDEDETFLEKYLAALTSSFVNNVNPLASIPFIKDIWSLAQGYSVGRSDMTLVDDFMGSVERLVKESVKDESDPKAIANAIVSLVGDFANFTGIPLKNLIREVKSIINFGKTISRGINGMDSTWNSIEDAFREAVREDTPVIGWLPGESKSDNLYEAIVEGDKVYADRIKGTYKDDKAVISAIRKALRENDPRVKEAAEAYIGGDVAAFGRTIEEIAGEGHFSAEDIEAAIRSEISKLSPKEETDEAETEEHTSIYRASDVNVALDSGDMETALMIIDDLVKTKVANGAKKSDARSDIRSSLTSYWKPLYKEAYANKDSEEMKRIRLILHKTGLYGSGDDVVKTTQGWLKD